MGLFSRLSKNRKTSEDKNRVLNTKGFVIASEEESFQDSMYGKLQFFKSEVEYISLVFPDKARYLNNQIDLIIAYLEKSNNEDDPEIKQTFEKLKIEFIEIRRAADGEYTIQELEYINRKMDNDFEQFDNSDGTSKISKSISKYENYIQKIQDKIDLSDKNGRPLLTNIQRQRFNYISLKSEYRLKMLGLLVDSLNNGQELKNPFEKLSLTKQKIFSKFIFEDIKEASIQYNLLMQNYETLKKFSPRFLDRVDSAGQEIGNMLSDIQMIEDFSIRQIFDSNNKESDSFKFILKFLKFKYEMNYLRNNLDRAKDNERAEEEKKRLEELKKEETKKALELSQKREKENLEKLANLTDAEIKEEIDRIEHDLTADGSRYVNILDFQKKIARVKGLLDSEKITQNPNLVYKNVDDYDVIKIIERGNAAGVNYLVFPNAQETGNGGYTVAVSKSDESLLNFLSSYKNKFGDKEKSMYSWNVKNIVGVFSEHFLHDLFNDLKSSKVDESVFEFVSAKRLKNGRFELSLGCYNEYNSKFPKYKEIVEMAIRARIQQIQNMKNIHGFNKDVLCNISIPANKNIIPILEQFKNTGIVPYIEPVPQNLMERNSKNRDRIQIYFERKNLSKYMDLIEPTLKKKAVLYTNDDIGVSIKQEVEER